MYDAQSFNLLTDPQSIMAIGLRFMTSKVMERVPVPDWKVGWEVSLILEALRECYPLGALDNLVSTYDKWYNLYKSMRKTITVNQANIALTRKQFSEQVISALVDYGDMPADSEAQLLSKFEKVFTHKDYGSNRLFQSDLKETLERDAAYTAKPSLQGLLTAAQLVMNSWRRMPSDNDNVPSLVLTRSARESPHRQSPPSALAPMSIHPRQSHCRRALPRLRATTTYS